MFPCKVNGTRASAFADTGSELMLVSGDFARRSGLRVDRDCRTRVQLADGSIAWTGGVVLDAELGFDFCGDAVLDPDHSYLLDEYLTLANVLEQVRHGPDVKSEKRSGLVVVHDLHIMESLPYDIVLSNQFVFEHRPFAQFVQDKCCELLDTDVLRESELEVSIDDPPLTIEINNNAKNISDVFAVRDMDDTKGSWWRNSKSFIRRSMQHPINPFIHSFSSFVSFFLHDRRG
jgi:hypothetical protein